MERKTYLETKNILDATIAHCEYMEFVVTAAEKEVAEEAGKDTDPGRWQMLLDSLRVREKEIREAFAAYREHAPQNVQQYFVQYTSDTLDAIPVAPETNSYGDMLRWVLACNYEWEQLYRELAFGTSTPEEKEAYEACADVINQSSRHISLDTESVRGL